MCPSVIAVFQGVCFTRTHSFSCLAPWPLYACQVCTHTCANTHTQTPDFGAWQSGMAIRLMQCHPNEMWGSFLHYLNVLCLRQSKYSNVSHMCDLFGKGRWTRCHLNSTRLLTTAKAPVKSQNALAEKLTGKKQYIKEIARVIRCNFSASLQQTGAGVLGIVLATSCNVSTVNSQQFIETLCSNRR